jgi:Zn-dependent protease
MDIVEIGAKLGIYFLPFLFALCFHEWAHGFVAQLRGDNTAKMMGRLTLNPMAHADPIGTFVLPIAAIVLNSPFFFGWAKPVPVNERNLKKPRTDMFWVALAGPASNIFLAFVGMIALAIVYAKFHDLSGIYLRMLETFLVVNLFLAVFNLIPIHPLDGGKVLEPFLPASWNIWLEQNQGTLNVALLIFLLMGGRFLAYPVILMAGVFQSGAVALSGML